MAAIRMSGFKRILVRLDEGIRRKYCCRALEEDLQRAKIQVQECANAMDEAKQVEDATCKLHASQQAAVSSEQLIELETLQQQLETAINRLVSQSGEGIDGLESRKVKEKPKAAEASSPLDAKTLARQIMQTKELNVAVCQIRKLEKLMPELKDRDDKKAKWWKTHVSMVVAHSRELVQGDREAMAWPPRLQKTLKKIKAKYSELKDALTDDQPKQSAAKQEQEAALPSAPVSVVKRTKKWAIDLPDEDPTVASPLSKRASGRDTAKADKPEAIETAKALLYRCSRDVRTLREKFELDAYDVNLSRMVTVVDSLWANMGHTEVVLLTTALFTLVEIVEKVMHPTKRRDRLVCLASVLGVVVDSSKLQLTARRKTMAEEYANNCRQSLEQLLRQSDNRELPAGEAGGQQRPGASAPTGRAWPKSHVRFG